MFEKQIRWRKVAAGHRKGRRSRACTSKFYILRKECATFIMKSAGAKTVCRSLCTTFWAVMDMRTSRRLPLNFLMYSAGKWARFRPVSFLNFLTGREIRWSCGRILRRRLPGRWQNILQKRTCRSVCAMWRIHLSTTRTCRGG